jgi:Uncharacterized protein conserved in bacteria
MSALSEEEQLDNLKSFAKKYGSAIVSGILIALIAFFGWEYWQKKTLAESQMQTAKVQQLMDDAQSATGDAFTQLSATADKIVKEAPDSPQAIQTQLLMAKLAYDKADYANAEKALKKVENSKVDDAGLIQLVKLRLAYAQLAQKKFDEALKTLEALKNLLFKRLQMKPVAMSMLRKMISKMQRKFIKVHGMLWLSDKKNVKFYKLNSKV